MMMGSNLMDGVDCASFFDQIDDLIDFLPEDKCEDVVGAAGGLMNSGGFPVMWDDDVPNPDVFLSKNSSADLSAELYVPYEDIVQLEWISNFVEDSFSNEGFGLVKDTTNKKDSNSSHFQVLESSSSSSSSTNSSPIETKPNGGIPPPCGPQRARSKRPRPATFSPRPSIRPVEAATASAVSENFVESGPTQEKIPEESDDDRETKKKKKKTTGDEDVAPAHQRQATAARKCAHCEITKTPQWRAGPTGPKTLCNACGVRYKSGRLFPEYRPAASPTFVPSVHSNSHKKVVEMRNKAGRPIASNASVAINSDGDDHSNGDA